ncbi:MAG: V-type ATP synthase subunit D [Pseudomonadota bacterium]
MPNIPRKSRPFIQTRWRQLMARLQLNKSSLAREAASLKTYQRFLPSLDLKRRQLMAERARAARALAETEDTIDKVVRDLGAEAPMLSNTDVSLDGLVTIRRVDYGEQNTVGVRLPTLESVEVDIKPYSPFAKPHWVDFITAKLQEALALNLRKDVEIQRLAKLDEAVKKIRQRVNLFEKVLIPRTQENIKRIKIYLSDEQVSGVVRSKLAKRKRAAATSYAPETIL